jgi:hypothetical protein
LDSRDKVGANILLNLLANPETSEIGRDGGIGQPFPVYVSEKIFCRFVTFIYVRNCRFGGDICSSSTGTARTNTVNVVSAI